MELLESALAFAVVMIILSTIVTGIVELWLRILGSRKVILRGTVVSLFENVVWPRLEARLSGHTKATGSRQAPDSGGSNGIDAKGVDPKAATLDDFLRGMTANPAVVSQTKDGEIARPKWYSSPLRALRSLNVSHRDSVDVLTPLAFAERLARTDVGKAILAEGKQELEVLVQDFVRSFDRYGRAASEVFRKKAKMVAMVVGVLFALIANVDASRLFTTLMNNPDLRTTFIEQAEEAAKASREAADSLEAIQARLDAEQRFENELETIRTEAAQLKASVDALTEKGLPVGHAYYPYCLQDTVGDQRCTDSADWGIWFEKAASWLLFTVIAGILIGLGGPFWYRVFSSLSQVFQVLRALGVSGKPRQAKPEELDALPSAEESAKPKDVLDAFKVAAHVHAASTSGQTALFPGVPRANRRYID